MPALAKAATAATVGAASTHESSPSVTSPGSQQLKAASHATPPTVLCRKLSEQSATSQRASALQLGSPSVARTTKVWPASVLTVGKRAFKVAAVGVPPPDQTGSTRHSV